MSGSSLGTSTSEGRFKLAISGVRGGLGGVIAFFSPEGVDVDSLTAPPIGSEGVEDSSRVSCALFVVAFEAGVETPPIGSTGGISFVGVEVGALVATGFPPPIGSGSTDSAGSRARAVTEVKARKRKTL